MRKVGDRVLGQKANEPNWYPGTIRHLDGERCFVIFDDGDDALIEVQGIHALVLHAGDQVFARLPTESEFTPARVVAWDDDRVQVHWDHGEENWVSYGMIRLALSSEGLPLY